MASMTLREAGQLYIIVLLQYFDIHEILAHLNEKDADYNDYVTSSKKRYRMR